MLQLTGAAHRRARPRPAARLPARPARAGRPWADGARRAAGRRRSRWIDRYAGRGPGRAPRALLAALRTRRSATSRRDLGAPRRPRCRRRCSTRTSAAGRESTLRPRRLARLAAEPLAAAGPDAARLRLDLPQRLTLKGFFLARYGAAAAATTCSGWCTTSTRTSSTSTCSSPPTVRPLGADGTYAPEENWLRHARDRRALDRARADVRRADARSAGRRSRRARASCDLDERPRRRGRGRTAPRSAPAFAPQSHFLQLAARRRPAGRAQPLATAACASRSPGSPTASTATRTTVAGGCARRPPGGSRRARCSPRSPAASATTNLNLHGRLTDYEIVCPGETQHRAGGGQHPPRRPVPGARRGRRPAGAALPAARPRGDPALPRLPGADGAARDARAPCCCSRPPPGRCPTCGAGCPRRPDAAASPAGPGCATAASC